MPRQCNCSRLTALACVGLAAGLLLPPGVYAEPNTPRLSLVESARLAAAREAGAMKERGATQAPPTTTTTNLRSGGFFKTPAGIATLVIFGAGVSYALYSANNDRIKSAGR